MKELKSFFASVLVVFSICLVVPVKAEAFSFSSMAQSINNAICYVLKPWIESKQEIQRVVKTETKKEGLVLSATTSSPVISPLIAEYIGLSKEEIAEIIKNAISALPNPVQNINNTYIVRNGGLSQGAMDASSRSINNIISSGSLSSPSISSPAISSAIFSGDTFFDTNTLTIDSVNNMVGIGTTSPSAKLSIDTSGSDVIPLIIKTNASPENNTPENSAIFIKSASGDESLRIFAPLYSSNETYNSLFIGVEAGFNYDDSDDSYSNFGIGVRSLYSITTGYENVALGTNSLYSNTTGFRNTALGNYSLSFNTGGDYNIAIGTYALELNDTGNSNVAIGDAALDWNVNGSYNVAIGTQALASAWQTSAANTAVGYQSGYGNNGDGYSSSNNSFFGYKSGFNIRTGSNNILIGYQAGDSITTGSNNLVIGYDQDVLAANTSNSLNIGGVIYGNLSTGNTGIGTTTPWTKFGVAGTVAMPALVNDSTGYYVCLNTATGQLATSTTACGASSIRFKENVETLTYGLNEVMELNPVFFTYKPEYVQEKKRQLGFIAEEVDLIVPELVARGSDGEIQGLDYPKFAAVLVKAIQELNKKFDDITATLTETFDKYLASHDVYIRNVSVDKLNINGDVNIGGKVCVDNTCLTKEQFKEMMLRSGVGSLQIFDSEENFENKDPADTVSADNTSTTTSETVTDSTANEESGTASTSPTLIDTKENESVTDKDSATE